jgi:DNA-binding transcriptional regulator YbjK
MKAGGAASGRRQRAVDAAIEVIAADGLRGLTHRAVDVRAGLPPGSTSSCFRTRLALLAGVLDRLVELDEAVLRDVPVAGWRSPDEIADLFTGLLAHWLGPARSRTLARLELYLDAARHTELTPELRAAHLRFRDRAAAGLRAAGLPEPDESARILLAQLDGLLYDALARPFAGGDEPAHLRRAVEVLVRGHLAGR